MQAAREQRQKRALNIVWTAAGDYGFLPDFLAFHRDGSPDIYLNSIVGFVRRYYDGELLHRYVCELEESLLRDTFTDILWLGLEEAAYGREVRERPVLAELRCRHAERFLQDAEDAAMQELMMRREIVHTLKAARCREILGKGVGLYNPWDRRLYAALRYPSELSTEEIIARTRDILQRFFVFRFSDWRRGRWHLSVGERWQEILRRLWPIQREYGDAGLSRMPHGSVAAGRQQEGRKGLFGRRPEAGRRQEIERKFGAPLYGEAALLALEADLCTGVHRGMHLYFARGKEQGPQGQANREHFRACEALYRHNRQRLRRYLEDCLLTCRMALPVRGRKGLFLPGQAWRGAYLGDDCLFALQQVERQADFSVNLMLDASASRQGQEPMIAAQAVVIAQSLMDAGIPVRIFSYCSLQGCTVLCVWKDFAEKDCRRVLGYSAIGWNRDGLALRAAGHLLARDRGRRVLLVLTDAHPSDDGGIPVGHTPFAWDYSEKRAEEDMAREVRSLRRKGIRVAGLIHSVFPLPMAEAAAAAVFGASYARVERVERLAEVVGRLLMQEISR